MINQDRIVPIMAYDLLSLYGLIMHVSSNSTARLDSVGIGEFDLQERDTSRYMCTEPVISLNIGTGVTSSVTIYFVADPNFKGLFKNNVAMTISDESVDVKKDSATLYQAAISGSSATITNVGIDL